MDNLLALWQQRTRRERHLLLGMGVMLLIGLIYYALWQPGKIARRSGGKRWPGSSPACDGCASRPRFSSSLTSGNLLPRRKNPQR